GTFTQGQTTVQGGSAEIFGDSSDPTRLASSNTSGVPDPDIAQNQLPAAFDPYLLSDAGLAALDSYAKSQGSYYQGTMACDASNRMPNGVIFVDSVSGTPVTATRDPLHRAELRN